MRKGILKSIGAVFAGFIVIVLLSIITDFIVEKLGLFPDANHPELYSQLMLVIALFYRLVYAVIGGYITAKLAPSSPMVHVAALGVVGTLAGILGSVANMDKTLPGTEWYPVALIILSIPALWLGGHFKRTFI
jgi:hypothetical protein